MATSWLTLVQAVLEKYVYQNAVYLPSGSWCEATAIEEAGELYTFEAGLYNINEGPFVAALFSVPTQTPEAHLSSYRVVSDSRDGYLVVPKDNTPRSTPSSFSLASVHNTPVLTKVILSPDSSLVPAISTSSTTYITTVVENVPFTSDLEEENFDWAEEVEREFEGRVASVASPHPEDQPSTSHHSSNCSTPEASIQEAELDEEHDVDDEQPEEKFHHRNFSGQGMPSKSLTPPEVSLWLALTSENMPSSSGQTRKRVILSQAGKFIDPVAFHGEEISWDLDTTALVDSFKGRCAKVYWPQGSWMYDSYHPDEARPAYSIDVPHFWNSSNAEGLRLAIEGVYAYDEDMLVNDDGRLHSMQVRRIMDMDGIYIPAPIRGPSGLSHVKNIEDDSQIEAPLIAKSTGFAAIFGNGSIRVSEEAKSILATLETAVDDLEPVTTACSQVQVPTITQPTGFAAIFGNGSIRAPEEVAPTVTELEIADDDLVPDTTACKLDLGREGKRVWFNIYQGEILPRRPMPDSVRLQDIVSGRVIYFDQNSPDGGIPQRFMYQNIIVDEKTDTDDEVEVDSVQSSAGGLDDDDVEVEDEDRMVNWDDVDMGVLREYLEETVTSPTDSSHTTTFEDNLSGEDLEPEQTPTDSDNLHLAINKDADEESEVSETYSFLNDSEFVENWEGWIKSDDTMEAIMLEADFETHSFLEDGALVEGCEDWIDQDDELEGNMPEEQETAEEDTNTPSSETPETTHQDAPIEDLVPTKATNEDQASTSTPLPLITGFNKALHAITPPTLNLSTTYSPLQTTISNEVEATTFPPLPLITGFYKALHAITPPTLDISTDHPPLPDDPSSLPCLPNFNEFYFGTTTIALGHRVLGSLKEWSWQDVLGW